MVRLSHLYMTTGKPIALTRWTFVGKVMSLVFNMISRFVIAFLPRSKHLLISWLQSPSAVILESSPLKTIKTQPMSSAKSSDSQYCLMVLQVSSLNQWHHYQLGSWWKCKHSGPTPDPLNQNLCIHNPPYPHWPQLIHVMLTWYIWCMWYSEQHYPIELFMIWEIQAVAWCCPCSYLTLFRARSLFDTSILPKFVLGSFLLHVTSRPLPFFFFIDG